MALILVKFRKIFRVLQTRRTLTCLWLGLGCPIGCITAITKSHENADLSRPMTSLSIPLAQQWGNNSNATAVLSVLLRDGTERPLAEADFLQSAGKSVAEWEGRCSVWGTSGASGTAPQNGAFSEIEFEAGLEKSSLSVRRVFALLRAPEKTLVGFGVFGSDGKARCSLSQGSYVASSGFGEARVETSFEVSHKNGIAEKVRILIRETGRVVIVPGAEQGILPGDMLRLGRAPLRDSTILFPETSISKIIGFDLFRSVESASENLGVSEYLATTLFVGKSPVLIDLDEGSYRFAIFSKISGRQCLVDAEIRKDAAQYLRCPRSDLDETALSLHRSRIDATYLNPETYQAYQNSGVLALQQSRFSTLQLSGEKTFSSGNIIFPRALDADGTSDPESACHSILETFDDAHRPVAGTGEKSLGNGATPFWVSTVSQFSLDTDERIVDANYFLTNGTDIEFSGVIDGPLWPPLSQQRVRAILRIPLGNPTSVVSIIVNGKELRKLAIPRTENWDATRFVIDQTLMFREDFRMAICAWGNIPLPEFITGTKGAIPLLVTRPVCVDVDGDGRCGVQQNGD